MKHCLFLVYSLAIGITTTAACADIDPQMTNDTLPLLPGEVEQDQITQLDYGELLAFPGAEGHGKNTVGGRDGKVYHVTTLEDNNTEGSFRWAVTQKEKRTIVFDVAGTIHLSSELKTTNDYLTIAGQTSPGGICIAGYPFTINSNQVIIRFLRFRPGNVNIESDGLGGSDKANVIVDHCSTSWCTDECLSVYGMENSTVQWCLAAQALRVTPGKQTSESGTKTHGFGGNWGGHFASYHHNMIAHCESRVPRLGPRPTTLDLGEKVDIRNNVFYNWAGEGCYGGEAQNVNIVNNYYKPGPATRQASEKVQYRIAKVGIYNQAYDNGAGFEPYKQTWGTFFIEGNYMDGNEEVTTDNWTDGVYAQQTSSQENDYLWNEKVMEDIKKDTPVTKSNGVTTHSAEEAYQKVLEYVGACNYRDAVVLLIINDVKEGKATQTSETDSNGKPTNNKPGYINDPIQFWDGNPYPELPKDLKRDITDSDGDGIPDNWEIAHGLNPDYALDGNMRTIDVHGKYSNLEMYMNSLVKEIMDQCQEGGTVIE